MKTGRKIAKVGGAVLRKILPKKVFYEILKIKIRLIGRPYIPGETTKAHSRREKEGFFKKYARGRGLDIGFGGDIISENAKGYDFEHGNAETLKGLNPEEKFDFVYSSHTLEHMCDPWTTMKIWFDRVKKNGYLIIYIPHRDLFEKKKELPSNWNSDHKYFYMPEKHEKPYTLGMRQLIQESLKDYKIVYVKTCDKDYEYLGKNKHSEGEYSIEAVIKKM